MKRSMYVRLSLTCLLVFSMLSPIAILAGDGNKYFKAGMKQEAAEQWDQAAEAFAMAVTEDPKNAEYRLHLQRSLFNASQMYMKKGRTAAENKDYEGAYVAFRKAYAFDPVNELAKSEMARMVRLQQGILDEASPDGKPADSTGKVKLVQTSYSPQKGSPDAAVPQKLEPLRQVPFPGGVNLQFIVKELAKDLDLNVLFDVDSRLENRTVRIDLKNVTSAKALDYIFLQENLFFQKVGPRTILVATGLRRMNFQQLVLRTFYLSNASPKDVKAVITAAIPAQPGRMQTIVLEDPSTNSVTVRDTKENIQLISKLIASLDKDRAEVVMDVAIYEVNKTDLLQFGNQIGTSAQLGNLGSIGAPLVRAGGNAGIIADALGFTGLGFSSIALGLPTSSLAALQKKNNTKLVASTQIHAFNNEDSSARIGQRVPVRTASFAPISGNNNNNNVFGDVFNYEQTGLTLKFKPIVFPNQDVQVAMEIESKDVAGGTGAQDQPIFIERTIKGTARVQNNKTLLLASVAQNNESNGRQGLPLLGLLPFVGRLFTAPTKNNTQVDIVIAITPRVIRAPAILPEDEVERDTGSLQTPTSGSLEAMIREDDRDEMLAAARRLPTNPTIQLPDQSAEAPTYVRTSAAADPAAQPAKVAENTNADTTAKPAADALNLRPIDTGLKTLQISETSDTSTSAGPAIVPIKNDAGPAAQPQTSTPPAQTPAPDNAAKPAVSGLSAELQLPVTMPELKAGQKAKIAVMVNSSAAFRSAVLGLHFDPAKLAIRSVGFGDIFGATLANTNAVPFLNQNGKMFVLLSLPEGNVSTTTGTLAFVEVEALADGKVDMTLEKDALNLLGADGKNFAIKL